MNYNKKTVKDINLEGKKVFVRCDFNVPMDKEQNITDNTRIVAALPTIKYLLEQNCKVILSSHQNGGDATKISHIPSASEHAQPPPLSTPCHKRGTFVTIDEPTLTHH